MNNLINIQDLTNISISKILDFSEIFKKSYKNNLNHNIDLTDLDDKVVGLMFFESSTRTNYSFQTALHKLGVKFLNFNDIFSSSNKGETLQDTIKTFECFCDLIIIRHPDKDIFKKIIFEKPVINAGNGSDQHPTQALLDLFTIYEKYLKKNDINSCLRISFLGDIKYSRTIHSLIQIIEKYRINNNIYSFSGNFKLLQCNEIDTILTPSKIHKNIYNSENLNNIIDFMPNVLYVTRIQKERIKNNISNDITVDNNFLNKLPTNTIVMHPLPRNNELDISCDNNHRSIYFEQVENGVYVRMAILYILLKYNNNK